MNLLEVKSTLKRLEVFNKIDREFRRTHPEDKFPLGYTGPGLRPRNALWILVKHLGLDYDQAFKLIQEVK